MHKCISIISEMIFANESKHCAFLYEIIIKGSSLEILLNYPCKMDDPDYRRSLRHIVPKQKKLLQPPATLQVYQIRVRGRTVASMFSRLPSLVLQKLKVIHHMRKPCFR